MISTGVANKGDCRYIKSKTREFNTVKLFLNHERLTSFYYKGLLSLNGESLLWLKFYLVFRYQHYTKNTDLVIQPILESRTISCSASGPYSWVPYNNHAGCCIMEGYTVLVGFCGGGWWGFFVVLGFYLSVACHSPHPILWTSMEPRPVPKRRMEPPARLHNTNLDKTQFQRSCWDGTNSVELQ